LRLQQRLTITAAGLITGVSLIVGSASVIGGYGREISGLKHQLSVAAEQITEASTQELSTALLIGQQQNLTVGLLDINGHFTIVHEGLVPLRVAPALTVLKTASTDAVQRTGTSSNHYVLRAVPLANNEWIVLAITYQPQLEAMTQNAWALVLYTGLADLLAVALISVLIRRDLRQIRELIAQARRIASGRIGDFKTQAGDTEVNQLSSALDSMVQQLTASRDEMQRFLGDASHELRTPLTVIRGYLEMIGGLDLNGAKGQEFLATAVPKLQSEVLRMQTLIEDLLLLAELGEPGQARHLAQLDLSAAVSDAVSSLRDLQPGRPVSTDLAERAVIQADSHLIGQLLGNVFGNIRRHTGAAVPVAVTLATDADSSDATGWVTLTIDDAGPGLSPEAYERGVGFFERFDPSRSRENGGSGLGMSIMAGVVAKHGGEMRLEPSPLGGLRSLIRLPLAAAL
jgi:two-component system OmpR family sensor kinase